MNLSDIAILNIKGSDYCCIISLISKNDRQTKWMYFLIEDEELLKKYDTIWNKVSTDIKKSLIASLSTVVFKNQNKSHVDEVTDFYDK